MSALSPCPFCGDERPFVEKEIPFRDNICHVECFRCGARGPCESADDRAVASWNKRLAQDEPDEALLALAWVCASLPFEDRSLPVHLLPPEYVARQVMRAKVYASTAPTLPESKP